MKKLLLFILLTSCITINIQECPCEKPDPEKIYIGPIDDFPEYNDPDGKVIPEWQRDWNDPWQWEHDWNDSLNKSLFGDYWYWDSVGIDSIILDTIRWHRDTTWIYRYSDTIIERP